MPACQALSWRRAAIGRSKDERQHSRNHHWERHMERDLAGAALGAEDFQRLGTACRHDDKFPKTYEAWRSLVTTGSAYVLAEGQHVQPISLVVDDFLAWCARVQVVPCLDALRAYMILLRRTAHDRNGIAAERTSDKNNKGPAEGKEVSRKPIGGTRQRCSAALGRRPACWGAVASGRSPLVDVPRRKGQASGSWQTTSMLCPSGPMTKAA